MLRYVLALVLCVVSSLPAAATSRGNFKEGFQALLRHHTTTRSPTTTLLCGCAPSSSTCFVARADAYLAKGETANAIADFRRAVALDRNVVVSYPGLKEKLSRLGTAP